MKIRFTGGSMDGELMPVAESHTELVMFVPGERGMQKREVYRVVRKADGTREAMFRFRSHSS